VLNEKPPPEDEPEDEEEEPELPPPKEKPLIEYCLASIDGHHKAITS
jgi:hypothetical protein